MKMFMIVYQEASDEDIVAAIKGAGFKAYTKMCGLKGEGEETEPKLGTHYWPGENNAMILAVGDDKIQPLCDLIRRLKVEHPRAGVKAFTFPLDDCI